MNFVQRMDSTIDLELAKKVFLGLSAGTLMLIPADGLWTYYKKIPVVHLSKSAVIPASEKPELLSAYQENFERNTLFGTVMESGQAPALKASIAELVKDYRLKGVVFLGEPEGILEDARTQKTVFVKAGHMVGDLTVKEIKEGSMMLEYLGEEVQLEVQ